MDDRIRIIIADDQAHDHVFAEIYIDDQFVASISQEDGPDQLRIEFPGPGFDEELIARNVPLTVFQRGIERALARLFPI
jgi:hypothetical protein